MRRAPGRANLTVAVIVLAIAPATVLAWGGSRSASGTGRYGGSYSHESGTAGGAYGAAHYGSGTYTSPSGQTYSNTHAGAGAYGSGWHGTASGSGPEGSYRTNYNAYGDYHGAYPAPYSSGYHATSSTAYYGNYHAAYGGYGSPSYTNVSVSGVGGWGAAYVPPAAGVYVAPAAPPPTVAVVGATPAAAVVVARPTPPVLALGTTVTVLPSGYTTRVVNGVTYNQDGPNWYAVTIVNGGVYFAVVKAP